MDSAAYKCSSFRNKEHFSRNLVRVFQRYKYNNYSEHNVGLS